MQSLNFLQDDLRIICTKKKTDNAFFITLSIAFFLFTAEILVTSIVNDDYKYSFFFNLDIIATLSLIADIPWMLSFFSWLTGGHSDGYSVNAMPGVWFSESILSSKIQQVIKSLRLIRLIRIIKLYKYIVVSMNKKEENEPAEVLDEEEEAQNQSLFQRETDPSKLGKALSD